MTTKVLLTKLGTCGPTLPEEWDAVNTATASQLFKRIATSLNLEEEIEVKHVISIWCGDVLLYCKEYKLEDTHKTFFGRFLHAPTFGDLCTKYATEPGTIRLSYSFIPTEHRAYFLNGYIENVSYDGGFTDGKPVDTVFNFDPTTFVSYEQIHSSKPGKNFSALLRMSDNVTLTHVTVQHGTRNWKTNFFFSSVKKFSVDFRCTSSVQRTTHPRTNG